VTAAGRVGLRRRSLRCPRCGVTAYPLDERVGLAGFLSPGATRLACLAAASWSFDVASDRLDEIAGLRIDDETIRRHCHKAAEAAGRRRRADAPRADAPRAEFAAGDEVEFLTDGVVAPTRDGWREGELPPPSAAVAYATTADCEAFAATWPARAEALGIDPAGPLTVLADWAEWIWRAAGERFPAAAQVLDIFHAGQHIAAAANALHGEGTAGAAVWLEQGRARLLADGWPGLIDHVGATPAEGRTEAGQEAIDEMIGYFAKHTDRLGYFGRLRAGRSIGSGAVEGLARRLGRRLKVPGRGWCVGNIDGMATLIVTVGTPEWAGLWERPAA